MQQQLSPAQKAWQTRRRRAAEDLADVQRHLAAAASIMNKYKYSLEVPLALVISAMEQLPDE